MSDIRAKYVPPAIDQTAFNCPHCGALAKQFWFTLHANSISNNGTPFRIGVDGIDSLNLDHIEDPDEKKSLKNWASKIAEGYPMIEDRSGGTSYDLQNLSLSKCFNCEKIAIWIHNSLSWPLIGSAPLPNPDLSTDVTRDYEEASAILNQSPRGAAALLRLGIQKVCKELGGRGRNIDEDIALLVSKGLDIRVKQALDVVRVIGNNAVHPGQIDLKDDRSTAEKLFGLVNLIAEIMISQPKHVATMFDGLPEKAKEAIDRRDGKPS